jgi:GNAT superfamily N-acetyltransferase
MKSLGLASDLLAMSGESVVEEYPDRIVQRTPAEPDFWFGNRLIFCEPPTDAGEAIRQFYADLPEARHVCLSWDVPNLSFADVQTVFAGTDLIVEEDDVLTLTGPIRRTPVPEGIAFRALAEADWAQSEQIAFDSRDEVSIPPKEYRAYLADRSATRRAQIARGLGQWFGAYDGDLLVADMGIFHDRRVIRYQSVQTRESHRRRGIGAALLVHAFDWARARAPEAVAVIVAETDSAAGQLYRRAGFALSETRISAYRPPE